VEKTLATGLPHSGQVSIGGAENVCTTSNRSQQCGHPSSVV